MKSSLEVRFLGQSGFLLKTSSSSLLIDPYNDDSGRYDGDILYCTHHHFDHTGGVDTFLERNSDAIFLCNEQVADKQEKWKDRITIIEDGQQFTVSDWHFSFTKLKHGVFGGTENIAVEAQYGDLKFAHIGDAKEFGTMVSRVIDVLAVPISGGPTASPSKVLDTLKNFESFPSVVIPMHWLIRRPDSFCKNFYKLFPEKRCIVPKDGEIVTI
ncbi:MAG: MBL fold metallo-hydrolase [Candidatus Lokiarchaeota archaeon]|nr:MBL fold metallo-hydrolase [Candidatus Lokiarchaeota archaeon]